MRTVISMLIVLAVAALAAGCSSTPASMQSAEMGTIPAWYNQVPQEPNFILAANTATSQDLQLAYEKATVGARAEIGRQVELKVAGLQKRFEEETGLGQDAELLQQFSQATKTVVSTTLSGTRVRDKKYLKDDQIYRAYVLVEYPIGSASAALMKAIRENEAMYTRFRASQAFKELDNDAQKFEQQKEGK